MKIFPPIKVDGRIGARKKYVTENDGKRSYTAKQKLLEEIIEKTSNVKPES